MNSGLTRVMERLRAGLAPREAYEVFRGSDQRLPVTVEVIYGLAFAGKQAVSLLRREDGLSVNVE